MDTDSTVSQPSVWTLFPTEENAEHSHFTDEFRVPELSACAMMSLKETLFSSLLWVMKGLFLCWLNDEIGI